MRLELVNRNTNTEIYNDYYQVFFFNKSCLLHITQTEQITAQNSLFNTGGMLG